ncbi:MAG: hypothetical protein GY834_15445 [Bacteroidetes bacterium]|nr:hypothetical protein [Bacteroidota bacterium]
MKVTNPVLLILLIISVMSCNSRSMQPDTIKTVSTEEVSGQHKANVEEVVQTSMYTYLRVTENDGESWVAISRKDIEIGQTVYFKDGLAMRDFQSKELNKTFDLVYFLQEIFFEPSAPIMPTHESGAPHGMLTGAEQARIEVELAEGGIRIAELFDDPAMYEGKIVKISGVIVKYNEEIMGTNWIHIQDGTVSDNGFDLTITTNTNLTKGDIITVEGVITLNKDFGAGYVYDVIIEGAKILAN